MCHVRGVHELEKETALMNINNSFMWNSPVCKKKQKHDVLLVLAVSVT